jgi:hypothetical protein
MKKTSKKEASVLLRLLQRIEKREKAQLQRELEAQSQGKLVRINKHPLFRRAFVATAGVLLFMLLVLAPMPARADSMRTAGALDEECKIPVVSGENLSMCEGYVMAVMDSLDDYSLDGDSLTVVKPFYVGQAMRALHRYLPLHAAYSEPANKAIIEALIEDGYVQRTPGYHPLPAKTK